MKYLTFTAITLILISSCSKEIMVQKDHNPIDIYDEFWTHVNQNYIYFDEKNVNWDSIYAQDILKIDAAITEFELLDIMESSLNQLRDSHNRLSTDLRPSIGYKYREEAPHFFSLELIQDRHFTTPLKQDGSLSYGMYSDSVFYVHLSKMERIPQLQKLIRNKANEEVKNIIIDLRNNSGGNSNDVPRMLGDFVTEKTYLGGYIEKTGPAREDESSILSVYAEPNNDFKFNGKVYVLINHVCYSATSYFAAMAKGLDNFTLIGQATGGGGGGNAGYELSNGWQLAISVSDFVDKKGQSIELGVQPDILLEDKNFEGEQVSDVVFEELIKRMN